MKQKNIKIIVSLCAFFILDLLRPFGYSFNTEFLFLGIVFLCFNYPLYPSLIISIIFGYLKDCVATSGVPISVIEFPTLCILIHYTLAYLSPMTKPTHKLLVKIFLFFSVCIIHMVINFLGVADFSALFSIMFMIQSFLIFLLINYFLKKWVRISSIEYI